MRNPFRNQVEIFGFEFLCELPRTIWIDQKIVNRRLSVHIHGISENLPIPAHPCNMPSARCKELLHDLLNTIHMLNCDGIRGKSSQVRNGPPVWVDLLRKRKNGDDQKSKTGKKKDKMFWQSLNPFDI